jgi:phage terminase large subunit
MLGVKLWSKQEEVLSVLPGRRRVTVKSGNGLGKGFCAAVAILWFLYSHDPAVVLSTAPTFRQVRHILWRQIRHLYRRAEEPLGGKMLDTRWELSEDRYALGLSADTADQFQGFHTPNMFIVVDEAEGVSDEIYEAIESVMTSAETSRLLLIGNPTTVSGAFRRAVYEERHLYHTITISALESPNVQAGRVVIPGLTTAAWVKERQETWGEENPLYRARVLGEFPDQADDTLIKLSDIEAAARGVISDSSSVRKDAGAGFNPAPMKGDMAVAVPVSDDVVTAVDAARFGSDRSVILRRRGCRVEEIRTFQGMDTMQLAGGVAAAINESQPD